MPEHLAIAGVDRLEPSVERSVKHYAAGGRESTSPHGIRLLDSPHLLSSRCIPGDEFAAIPSRAAFLRSVAPNGWRSRDVRHRARLEIHAEIVRRNIEQARLRGERGGLLILSAFQARTDI